MRATDLLDGRRLLLVSNREPYKRKDGESGLQRSGGGLVTALDPVMRKCGGVWIAWDPGGDPGTTPRQEVPESGPTFTLRQVPLSLKEVAGYYHGFANRALWPLCHYTLDRCHFDRDEWRAYVTVNEKFADAVAEELRPDDLLWIHDYHFCLLPRMVRERRPDAGPIAFFLHIPFPAEDLFRTLPWRREILQGLLGADLVGFHIDSYAGHFMGCCRRLLGAEVDHDRGLVRYEGGSARVGAYPIGIDVEDFETISREPEVRERAEEIREGLQGRKMVLGVDRLDYSKGIPARLQAIDALFERYPEHRGKLSFVQVAVPSRTKVREYRMLKRQIDELVGRINGRYGDAEWQPIRYLFRSLPRPELVAHYLAADVALITPLRDGMNLVAKEYVASKTEALGALVLSEFTGAAECLSAGAFVVNPFNFERVADALHAALAVEPGEARERLDRMHERVVESDVHRWLLSVLRDAQELRRDRARARARA